MRSAGLPLLIETAGPVLAEAPRGGTPWHPHHIAERYGLLAIMTLGEGILGTIAAMSGLVHDPGTGCCTPDGWRVDQSGVDGGRACTRRHLHRRV